MKRIYIMLIILWLMLLNVAGQKSKDALYLKNGSIIYGELTEISANQYKIKTSDGSIFMFQSDEVDKLIKESPSFTGRVGNSAGFSLEAGFLIGSQRSDYIAPFSFNLILNLASGTQNIFGIGTGVEYLGKSFTPFFLEYRYLISDKKTAPFLFTRVGGVFYLGDEEVTGNNYYSGYNNGTTEYKGGFSYTLGTGISWAKPDYEMYLSFAFRYAHISSKESNYNSYEYTYTTNFNRLEIKYGFKF